MNGRGRIQHIRTVGITTLVALVSTTIGLSAYVTTALYKKNADLGTIGGDVSLRSYFQKGSGTQEDPFVISRPIHFYNFSRLQNLGVFATEKYFSLGYDPAHPDDPYGEQAGTDLTFYKDNSSSELVTDHTLDMSVILNDSGLESVSSIGNEAAPFYGQFNGNGLAIKGLKCSSTPEDVGVFGYTYPGSEVKNLYLIDPKVTDDGYQTSAKMAPMYSDPESLTFDNLIVWNNGQSIHEAGTEPVVDTATSKNPIVNFPDSNPRVNITATLPELPSQYLGVRTEFRSSSPLITVPESDGGVISNLIFNSAILDPSDARYDAKYEPFVTSSNGGTFQVRISLVASSTTNEGVHYSKVLSTYLIVLIHNVNGLGETSYSYQVIKDDYRENESGYTQYKHGANIGLLCGHAEGGFTNCFIYGGTISVNNSKSGISPIEQESAMGLIGELGTSSNSSILPSNEYEGDKDTGVLNFTKIYEDIAGGTHTKVSGAEFYRYNPGEHSETFTADGVNKTYVLSYEPENITSVKIGTSSASYTKNGSEITLSSTPSSGSKVTIYYTSDSADKYSEYILSNGLSGANKWYVTKKNNTVDFIGKRVIEDTQTDKSKGLGVFSLITSPIESDSNNTYTNRMGDFVISNDNSSDKSETYTDFYYTTAEWNADPDNDGVSTYEDVYGWFDGYSKRSGVSSQYHINQPYNFPNNVTPNTWNPYFERYFNYNIHCDFSEASTSNNYFFNTDSEFLQSYFKYKLIDSAGNAPEPGDPTFGVFVRNIDSESGKENAITKFDSVLAVKEDSSNKFNSFDTDYSEIFTGNGIEREFDLKHIPASVTSAKVNGTDAPFTLDQSKILFNTAPANNAQIVVNYVYKNPAQSVVFSVKNEVGANITLFASSTSTSGDYVGIYKTSRSDLYNAGQNITSKPDYAMYLPYYPETDSADRGLFHYYDYDYLNGGTTSTKATDELSAQSHLYAHTFFLPRGEYLVSSPEGTAQLVYLCAQGQNGQGNTGLSQPDGLTSIQDVDFIAEKSDPKTFSLDSAGNLTSSLGNNIRCYFKFSSNWDNSVASSSGSNDLVISTKMVGLLPTVDVTSGSNLTYFLADNEKLINCSFNDTSFNKQFYEYKRP